MINYFPKPRKGKLPKNVDEFGIYCHNKDDTFNLSYINLNFVNEIYINEYCNIMLALRSSNETGDIILHTFEDGVEDAGLENYTKQFYKRVLLPYNKWKRNNDPLVNVLKEIKDILMYQPGGVMSKIAESHFKKISGDLIDLN